MDVWGKSPYLRRFSSSQDIPKIVSEPKARASFLTPISTIKRVGQESGRLRMKPGNSTLRQRQLFKGKWDVILEYEQKNGKGKKTT
jgi:hypothetical protein